MTDDIREGEVGDGVFFINTYDSDDSEEMIGEIIKINKGVSITIHWYTHFANIQCMSYSGKDNMYDRISNWKNVKLLSPKELLAKKLAQT